MTTLFRSESGFRSFTDKRKWLIILLFVGGIFVRLFLLGIIPPGLNQDEASIGYDAWALLHYGIDRNGFHNPVHLISWGSGQNALYAYLSMPFILLFDLNPFSVRILNALLGCLSLVIFYLLVKKIRDEDTGIIALFLLTISPWHIMMSRWGLESNIFPFFVLMGSYLLVLSLEKPSFLPLSFLVFAVSLYSYGTAYFFVPIFLLVVSSYLLFHKKIRTTNFLLSGGIFLIAALPILLFLAINIFKLNSISTPWFSIPRLPAAPRFSAVSSIFSSQFITNSIYNLGNFLWLLFVTQNDGLIWNCIPEYGYMFLFSVPFLFFGIFHLIRENRGGKKFNRQFIILAWFFVATIMAFVTSININRINVIFLPVIYFIAIGISYIKKNAEIFFRYLIILYALFFGLFTYTYFFVYPESAGPAFFESLDEAIQYATEKAPPDEPIYVTSKINMPYIFILFYQKIDPNLFCKSVVYSDPEAPFRWVESFDCYLFGVQADHFPGQVYILHNSEKEFFDNPYFAIERFKNYSVAIRKE
ncbi:MAG: hypothetical protein PWP04_21 [Candidatus Atribacteria bacterium]|nr:hypothetical protein [Candidatus Atribacteria bacterium]